MTSKFQIIPKHFFQHVYIGRITRSSLR